MKVSRIIAGTIRTLLYIVLAIFLLAAGLVGVLYSPWSQELVRKAIVAKASSLPGGEFSLDAFSLRFPLKVQLRGLAVVAHGDTVIGAESLDADVALLPLLVGRARLDGATARRVRYQQGSPDSVMYMTLQADSVGLAPASVSLGDMDISLSDGTIAGARVAIYLKPDTSAPTPPAPPTRMSISLDNLALKDFEYTMRLMPSIDTLTAYIPSGLLSDGKIDLLNQQIQLRSFEGSGLAAKYIAPDSAAIALAGPYPAEIPADSMASAAPWTIQIDSIAFEDSRALYTTAGVKPLPGLDFGYIEVGQLDLTLKDFYNRATTLRLPLQFSGRERSGVDLSAEGELDIDSVGLSFKDFVLRTPEGTKADFHGHLGMGDMVNNPDIPLGITLDGAFSPSDLSKMFPAFSPYLAGIPTASDILLGLKAEGTSGKIDIDRFELKLNKCLTLKADGSVDNIMNPAAMGGDISLSGNIINVNTLKNKLLDPATAKSLAIPPMTLAGRVQMKAGAAQGRLSARTKGGQIKLDGRWNSRRESYAATVNTDRFPVNAFMPLLEVGAVTASIKADGHGYNPFVPTTEINALLDVKSATFRGVDYTDINGKAHLADGQAEIELNSANPAADLSLVAKGNLAGDVYNWNAKLDGRNVDLGALKFSAEPATLEVYASADATIGPSSSDIKADVDLQDLFFRRHSGTIALSDVALKLDAADSLTTLRILNRDLVADFDSPCSIDTLATRFSRASEILAGQMESYMIDVDTLGQALPPFNFGLVAGRSNLINDILAPSKMSVQNVRMRAAHDSIIYLDGYARRFDTGSMRIDSVFIGARQHGKHIHLDAGIENRRGNLDQFHKVSLKGLAEGNTVSLGINQQNVSGKTGYDIGIVASAHAADSTLTLNIRPYTPTIAYQPWLVNEDNYLSYHIPDKHIDANLRMNGGNSSLAIYTEHHPGNHEQEDLVVKLSDIHIADWIALNPFAPPMKGDVSADMRLNMEGDQILGKGSAGITNFVYGRDRVADFNANFDIAATPSGTIRAKADLLVDGVKTITVSGALNDSTLTSPMALDFSMIHFPLATVNPFLPPGVAKLSGMLNGRMDIEGTSDKPIVNGYLDFDSTAVRLALTGTQYHFSEDSIAVRDNVVDFRNFTISGCNENPLKVNGTVDFKSLSNMKFNLGLKANNMQIVNTNKASKGADVFGKAFVDIDAHATGSSSLMSVGAKMAILAGTNVTYVIPDATSAIANRSTTDMVKFVDFSDSTAVAMADTLSNSGMAMFLDAELRIEDGSIVNVDLSTDGKNRVQVLSNGTLSYTMTPLSQGRLVGRLNIDGGFVRYSQPPVISEKVFNFQNNSYVAFNGDIMNPTLNVHAVDVIKANVTQTGQNSRLVNFDVSLGVTGTLNQMNVAFDMSTNDDLTVANELQSMTPEQRANQAMNLLLYNVYTGPGTKGNASLAGNPLFSFLESQVNSWAANNIKGVDISFGIDQYDRTVNGSTSSTMSYSYQVSKSLFNDRFKIVVGGNYSTDANADENFSQNLINDISFEYFLNKTRTMYVRLFRHTGYESILEGEVTQTGVGFVYRRKLRRLGDMFLPPSLVKRREESEAARDMEKGKENKAKATTENEE